MSLAPIVLFVYNRLYHTKRTLTALAKNELAQDSILYIYSDGPKNKRDRKSVEDVRVYLKGISNCFKDVIVIERKTNLGLAQSVITGVSEVINNHGRAIVLEDDLEVSPYFLRFMNDALIMYLDENMVGNIHGYVLPGIKSLNTNFFSRWYGCWGWATWDRSWKLFQENGSFLLHEIREKKLIKHFNFGNSYPFFEMLEDQVNGKNDSWAIRWNASLFLSNKLCFSPQVSLVRNFGFDNTGTHCEKNTDFDVETSKKIITCSKIPILENKKACKLIRSFFKQHTNNTFYQKAILFLKRRRGVNFFIKVFNRLIGKNIQK